MGEREEQIVRDFLACTEGPTQDVDGIVSRMTDDVVWQINVPSWKPRIGLDACRSTLESQNTFSTGLLPGSVIRTMASSDSVVVTERTDVFEMGGTRVVLRINGVFELRDGKIAAWREYYDSVDLASQLGVDVRHVVER